MDFEKAYNQYNVVDKKGFSESEFATFIRDNLDSDNANINEDQNATLMAFDFHENYPKNESSWGTYFGPQFVWPKDGIMYENPSIQLVTDKTLAIWLGRANEAKNPILKARYYGLIYDFEKLKAGRNPSIETKTGYISSLLDIAEENYYKRIGSTYIKIKRALTVALLIKNAALIERAKSVLIKYESDHGTDESAGLWGYSYDLLVDKKNIKLSLDEENLIIQTLEGKFDRLLLSEKDKANGHSGAEHAGIRLAEYYKKRNWPDKVLPTIKTLCEAITVTTAHKSAMHVTYHLNRNYKLYKKFQLNDLAKKVLLQLREESPKMNAEMGVVSAKLEVPVEKFNEILDAIVSGTKDELYYKLIGQNVLVKAEMEKHLKSASTQTPLSYLFTKQIQDHKGRIVAVIGNLKDDYEGNLFHHYSHTLTISTIFLIQMIDKAISTMDFNAQNIISKIKTSPIFDENRIPIIERGLQAFFVKDFLVSMHLIIPQIEEAIRNAVELLGGVVLRPSTGSDVALLRTFDDLLTDATIIKLFGEDLALQFRMIFTEQKGWNLRNNVCHGIAQMESFNAQSAYWVVHSLMALSAVQEQD